MYNFMLYAVLWFLKYMYIDKYMYKYMHLHELVHVYIILAHHCVILQGSMVQGTLAQGTPPPLLVTPPHGGGSWTGGPFPGPPLNMSTWAMAPSPSSTSVETIKQEKAALQSEVERLNAELSTLRLSAVSEGMDIFSCNCSNECNG